MNDEIRQKLYDLSVLISDEHSAHARVSWGDPGHFYGEARFERMQALCHEIAEALEAARPPLSETDLEALGWAIEEGRREYLGNTDIKRYIPHIGSVAARHLGIKASGHD